MCCQYFKIAARVAVHHQQARASYGVFKFFDLPAAHVDALLRVLPLRKSAVDLSARIDKFLPEGYQSFLLLCFGDFQICDVSSFS